MGARDESVMWDDVVGLKDQGFDGAVRELSELKLQMNALEVKIKDKQQDIEAMLIVSNQKRVRWEHYCIERSGGRSPSRVDPKLLATKGVSAEVISASTIPGKPYTYVQLIDLTKKQEQPEPDGNA